MADEILNPAKRLVYWDNLPADWRDDNMAADAVQSALARFEQDVGHVQIGSTTGDGSTRTWDLSDLSLDDWVEGDSAVLAVAFPWSATDENWIEDEDWSVIEDPTNGATLVCDSTPDNAVTVAIKYTSAWGEDDVPVKWQPGVAKLAAAHMARAFAGRRAATGDQSINAAVSVGPSESRTWLDLARDLEKAYRAEVTSGVGDDGKEAALVIGQIEPWYGPSLSYYGDD